jgi:hypothetical protein
MQPKLGTPRAVILSGMYTGELLEVISYYKDVGENTPILTRM